MITNILLVSALILATVLFVSAALLWRRVTSLETPLREASTRFERADEVMHETLADQQGLLLTVEVLNPLELAREHSRLASSLSAIAPNRVRRRVYDTVAYELRQELAERGVQARVAIRKAAPPS